MCGRHAFPRAADCPLCGAPDPEPVSLSTTGTLWGWTSVTAAPPGYHGEVPFGFGVVELPEGVRVITRLTAPVEGYTFGQPMHLRFVELPANPHGEARVEGDGEGEGEGQPVTTWEFAPS